MGIVALSDLDVRALAPMSQVIDRVRESLVDVQQDQFDLPQRHVFSQGSAIVMPTYHRPSASVVVKTLTLRPDREPLIEGTVTWANGSADTVIADARALTAIRTGAIVGLAVDVLSDPAARRATLLGAGTQAADQIRGLLAVRALERVTIVARRRTPAEALSARMRAEFSSVEFPVALDPAESFASSQIVCCATSSPVPVLRARDLPTEVTVTAIGSFRPDMSELPVDLLRRATVVAVDDRDACLIEAGEVIDAVREGAVSAKTLIPLADLCQEQPATPRGGTRVFKTVGLAAQDWAAMAVIHQNMSTHGPKKPRLDPERSTA